MRSNVKWVYVCSDCGSQDVQLRAWINPNTQEIIDIVSDDIGVAWCEVCKEHVELIEKEIEEM